MKKTYIGCNNPKNEKEDLNVVMPRLGKKYYKEAITVMVPDMAVLIQSLVP